MSKIAAYAQQVSDAQYQYEYTLEVAQANLLKARQEYDQYKDGPARDTLDLAQAELDNAQAKLELADHFPTWRMCEYNGSMRGGAWLPPLLGSLVRHERRPVMGDKRSKKDKNKANKQKQAQLEKKKEQQKNKLPVKKPA